MVEDSIIAELLDNGQQPETPVDTVVDATDCVLLPGLINTHHHYYQTLTRALPPALNKSLFPWLQSLYPVWSGLDEEMITTSTQLACAELMLSGCTTSVDHHYLFPRAAVNAVNAQVRALEQLGMRAMITRGSMSLGEQDGGLPPQSTVQSEDIILQNSEQVIDQFHQAESGAMIQIALAPCSPFSVSQSLMRQSAELARRKGVRLHTHLAETTDENEFCRRRFGMRPLEYLDEVDWLANDVWLAHGIFFDDAEIDRIGRAGVAVSHCPSSNMMLGSGQCRVLDLEKSGAVVGLGVDGSASNDGSNMMQEVRQAFLLQRLQYGAARVSHMDALRWATEGSASCIGRSDIGRLAVGMQADIALFKLNEARFSGSGDPIAALVLCGAHQVHSLMVAGQWRVFDGELSGLELPELQAKHHKLARKLVAKRN